MPKERGRYIVIEGGDNVDKTTQSAELAERIGAVLVREPCGTPLGEHLQAIIRDPLVSISPHNQALLHAAGRAELFADVIEPALTAGRNVVSSGSWLSSLAVLGAQGVPVLYIEKVNRLGMVDSTEPDLLIVLDADPEIVLPHDASHGDTERSRTDFDRQVRQNYLRYGTFLGGVVIDATMSQEVVSEEIAAIVGERLGL